jgi:hypothetical protein
MHPRSSPRHRAPAPATFGPLVAVAAAAAFAGPAAAVTTNPIWPGLPLDIRARASCMHVSSTNLLIDDQQVQAACDGVVIGQSRSGTTILPGTSHARARLDDGTLAIEVVSRSVSAGDDSARVGGMAHAYLYDTLTVEGNFTGTRMVQLRLDVDGRFPTSVPAARWTPSRVSAALSTFESGSSPVAYGTLGIGVANDGTAYIESTESFGTMTVVANTAYIFDPQDVRVSFTYTFTATPTDRSFTFRAQLSGWGGIDFQQGVDPGTVAEGRIDFGNTARLSLVMPSDVTVTSASGVFLTPVPEPPAALLLVAGVAVLALRRRGRGPAAARAASREARAT